VVFIAQIIDVQINLTSPVLTTSASCMKTLKIKLQNLRKDSEVGGLFWQIPSLLLPPNNM
jgi:hypothetical protein